VRRPRSRAGFTLIEVLVAAVLLATAVVGALGAFSASSRALGLAQFNSTVTQLAQGKMAETRVLDDLPLGETEGDFGEEYPGWTWRMNIQEAPEVAISDQDTLQGMFEIELVITGRLAGKAREVTFLTQTL
jgi:general secretion pathway protein I